MLLHIGAQVLDTVIGLGYILFLKWSGILLENLLQKKEQGFLLFKP